MMPDTPRPANSITRSGSSTTHGIDVEARLDGTDQSERGEEGRGNQRRVPNVETFVDGDVDIAPAPDEDTGRHIGEHPADGGRVSQLNEVTMSPGRRPPPPVQDGDLARNQARGACS